MAIRGWQYLSRILAFLTCMAVAVLLGNDPTAAQNNKVVIGMWGGSWGEYLRGRIDEFAGKSGIEVVYVESTSASLLSKALAQRSKPEMDIFLGNETTMAQAKQLGVSAPLDEKIVSNLAYVSKQYRHPDIGLIWAYWPVGFAYLASELDKSKLAVPDTWDALLRPDLKGKICLISPPNLYGEATLIGLGRTVGADERNLDPVFKLLPDLKANALTAVPASGQAEDLTRAKECWVHPTSPARAWLLRERGLDVAFVVPKDTGVISLNAIMLVKNGPNPKAAQQILNYLLSVPVQEHMADFGVVMPTNAKAEISKSKLKFMGLNDRPGSTIHVIDGEIAAAKLSDWTRKWTEVVAK